MSARSGSDGRLRVAIAGCHRMVARTPGSHNWAAAFAAVPEAVVVAVFDRGAETRTAFQECWRDVWGAVPLYDDYGRMLTEARPDIVCVATRQTMHADQIEQAVAAGVRGILCDKPLATSLEEADRIAAACRRAAVPLAFGLDRRWMPHYRRLRDLLADGLVGRVQGVAGYGCPNLINHGCHWYDAALALAGDSEPAWVQGLVVDLGADPPDSRRRMDPPGRVQVGLTGGAVASVVPEGGPRPAFDVIGDRGRVLLLNDGREAYLWSPPAAGGNAGTLQPVDLPADETLWPAGPAAVHDLVQAVRTGGTTACDVDQALRATEIGFAAHASHAAGGARVALPLQERSYRVESFPWGNE